MLAGSMWLLALCCLLHVWHWGATHGGSPLRFEHCRGGSGVAIERDPWTAGQIKLRGGDYIGAREDFQECVGKDVQCIQAHISLGHVALKWEGNTIQANSEPQTITRNPEPRTLNPEP